MLHLDIQCPLCIQGLVGFRRCADGATIVLQCDECDALWNDPTKVSAETARWPADGDRREPWTGLGLGDADGGVGWASRPDLERVGWSEYARAEYRAPWE